MIRRILSPLFLSILGLGFTACSDATDKIDGLELGVASLEEQAADENICAASVGASYRIEIDFENREFRTDLFNIQQDDGATDSLFYDEFNGGSLTGFFGLSGSAGDELQLDMSCPSGGTYAFRFYNADVEVGSENVSCYNVDSRYYVQVPADFDEIRVVLEGAGHLSIDYIGLNCTTCGDGLVRNEECDDGNTTDGDGCSSTCEVEAFDTCVGEPSTCSETICEGNFYAEPYVVEDDRLTYLTNIRVDDGVTNSIHPFEDDANVVMPLMGEAGDIVELDGSCSSVFGDGAINLDFKYYLNGVEVGTSGVPCYSNMTKHFMTAPAAFDEIRTTLAGGFIAGNSISIDYVGVDCRKCGDGVMRAEACDDGNTVAGDGCSSECAIEDFTVCSGEPSVCEDGVCERSSGPAYHVREDRSYSYTAQTNIQKDDEVTNVISSRGTLYIDIAGDGDEQLELDVGCENDFFFGGGNLIDLTINFYMGELLTSSKVIKCDGSRRRRYVLPGAAFDSVRIPTADIRLDLDFVGYACSTCGDGFIREEACDDGNTIDGDGCSSTCELEDFSLCVDEASNCSDAICQRGLSKAYGLARDDFSATYTEYPNVFADDDVQQTINGSRSGTTLFFMMTGDADMRVELDVGCESDFGDSFNPTLAFYADGVSVGDVDLGCSRTVSKRYDTAPADFDEIQIDLTDREELNLDFVGAGCTVCGDGSLREEDCDDGNTIDGDGCSSVCEVEAYHICAGEPSECIDTICANNNTGAYTLQDDFFGPSQTELTNVTLDDDVTDTVTSFFEVKEVFVNLLGESGDRIELDMGCAHNFGDSFTQSVKLLMDGVEVDSQDLECTFNVSKHYLTAGADFDQILMTVPDSRTLTIDYVGSECSVCGDGAIREEACDDGNTTDGDGCSAACVFESGFSCDDAEPSVCMDNNECDTDNGGCAQACTNTPGSFSCSCDAGYALNGDGVSCDNINECATDNGGCDQTCTDTDGSFECSCNSGYTLNANGVSCDDINECLTDNGGCSDNATCTNRVGSRLCTCDSGYSGDGLTCDNVNECATGNGGCDQTCTDTDGSFECSCNSGYTLNANGASCDDINECLTDNGGCSDQATCTNRVGSRLCTCDSGYSGDGLTCSDIDECATENGGCAQVCSNAVGSFSCGCDSGYSLNENGFSCDNIDECATENGGCAQVCTDNIGGFTCSCNDGYVLNEDGTSCDNIDECLTENGGCEQECSDTDGSFDCSCGDGYTLNSDGLTCDNIDECLDEPCDGEDFCVDSTGSYECITRSDEDKDFLDDYFDPDNTNPDIDGDGIPDGADVDIDGDDEGDNGEDTDGDGINDEADADVDGDGEVDNGVDTDGDGVRNGFDMDIDGDGIPNDEDPDVDGDGLPNDVDADVNGDGENDNGDDTDGDGINDEADADVDGDGENDNGEDTDGDGISNEFDDDIDGDGIPNDEDPDMDGDGLPNDVDADVDGDGENDNGDDTDGDGINDEADADVDGDGENDNGDDLDGDGIIDEFDDDIDGDGTPNDEDDEPENPCSPTVFDGCPTDDEDDEDDGNVRIRPGGEADNCQTSVGTHLWLGLGIFVILRRRRRV